MSKKRKKFDKKRTARVIIAITMLALIVALCVSLLVFCEDCKKTKYNKNYKYDGTALIGKWTDSDFDKKSYDVYNFVDEDTVILTTNTFGIELQRLEASYEVADNNQLVATYTYKDNLGNDKTQRDYFRFSITKKGELVLVVLDDMNNAQTERLMSKCDDLGYNKGENTLVGTWEYSGPEGIITYTFNSDYTGTMRTEENGEIREPKLYYSYKDGTLYYIREFGVSLQEQVRESAFRIDGNTLYLGTGDSAIEFTKR